MHIGFQESSQSGQWCLSGQLIPKQLSLWKQPGLSTPFARPGPQHPVLCMGSKARQNLKCTTLIASLNEYPRTLWYPVSPLTWKSVLAKLLFLSIKITGVVLSPSLPVLICFPKVLATAGHLLGDSRPTCHSFLSWDVPNKIRKS